jgi:uncharacterized protein YjiS (DUF1127 family)
MAIYDGISRTTYSRSRTSVAALLSVLARSFAAARERRREYHTVVELSRLDRRRLYDMGIDPEATYDAVEGTWNELPERPRFPIV